MHPDLVAGVDDHLRLLRERLDRVARNEPGRLHVVLVEQLQQAPRPDLAGEHAAGDVVGRVLAAVRAEPAGDRVDVDADTRRRSPSPSLSSRDVVCNANLQTGGRTDTPCASSAVSPERATGPSRTAAAAGACSADGCSTACSTISGCSSTTGAAASTCCATRKGRTAVVANLGALWVEAERLAAGRSTRSIPAWSRRCREDAASSSLTGLPRQRQDDAALAAPRPPRDGRDGGDRQRARRGRDRPPPAAAGRRAHGRARERLRLLHAPRRPRRRAARPARPARPRRDPRVRPRRRRDDRPRRSGADPLHAARRAGGEAPLRARARGHDRRRAARAAVGDGVGQAGRGRRPARGHEAGPRRSGSADAASCAG